MVLQNTIVAILFQGIAWGSVILYYGLDGLRGFRHSSLSSVGYYLAVVLGLAAVVTLPWFFRALWLFIKHGTLESSLRNVGKAVVETLMKIGLIVQSPTPPVVRADKGQAGHSMCWLEGATAHECALFVRAMRELVEPLENPRYLISRRKKYLSFWREDYHAVPEAVAKKKAHAETFAAHWRRHVGPAELVYTRTPEGRKILLRARGKALAASFVPKSERITAWK